MKILMILALLLIGAAIFYFTGGGDMLGLTSRSELPETTTPPNATFIGNEQSNPFATNVAND